MSITSHVESLINSYGENSIGYIIKYLDKVMGPIRNDPNKYEPYPRSISAVFQMNDLTNDLYKAVLKTKRAYCVNKWKMPFYDYRLLMSASDVIYSHGRLYPTKLQRILCMPLIFFSCCYNNCTPCSGGIFKRKKIEQIYDIDIKIPTVFANGRVIVSGDDIAKARQERYNEYSYA